MKKFTAFISEDSFEKKFTFYIINHIGGGYAFGLFMHNGICCA